MMSVEPTVFRANQSVGRQLRFADTQASVLLDLVRGLAAVLVLLEHWRNVFFVDYQQIAEHKALYSLPYLAVGAGHQAVVIFFVLSGYLISGSVFKMFEKGCWSWRTYGIHRLVRLWIVLVPGLLLTSLWDRMGMHLQRAPAVALYAGFSHDHLIHNIHLTSGWLTGVGNLVFLQSLIVPVFGSDGALWSLANEFWYYVLFPLGFIALRPDTRTLTRIVNSVLFLCVACFLRHGILRDFPIWLLGMLLVVVPPLRATRAWRWAAAAVYVPILYGLAKMLRPSIFYRDYMLAVATFLLLWILLSARSRVREDSTVTRRTRALARFSYTIYVAHTPLLVLLAALVLGAVRWQPDAVHLLAGAGLLVLVLGYCFVLAKATEFQTDRVRAAIERRLGMGAAVPGSNSIAARPLSAILKGLPRKYA